MGAAFAGMLMDRLQVMKSDTVQLKAENTSLQSQVDELQRELDKRPRIYLTQHSDFQHFSEGWEFCWDSLEQPGRRPPLLRRAAA